MAKTDDWATATKDLKVRDLSPNRKRKIDVVGRLEWIEGMWQMIQCAKRSHVIKSKNEDIRQAKTSLVNT